MQRVLIRERGDMMQKEKKSIVKADITQLSNELTYRRYLMNKGQMHKVFKKMTISEYIALHSIAADSEISDIYSGKTYLNELAEKMQLTIRQTSKLTGQLRDRGLVLWSHDGDGSEGTYVTITETGERALYEQEEILKQYYGKVIEKYGRENLIQLLQMMKQLETIMSSEIEELEAESEDEE